MRRALLSALVAGGLVAGTTGIAATDDEDLRMGDDPAYYERLEVPEAGIAVALPSDWVNAAEMRYGQTQPGDPYTGYWDVARGSDGERSCSLRWRLYPGPSLAETGAFGQGGEDALANAFGEGADVEVTEVELPVGVAYRLELYDPVMTTYSTSYQVDAGGTRYDLTCYSDEPVDGGWLDIATRLEWLPSEARLELPLEPLLSSGERVVLSPPAYELETVEVPEAGIAMLLPTGWKLDVVMEERELELPPDLADEGPLTYQYALHAEGDSGDWCALQIHPDNPLTIWDHTDLREALYEGDAPEDMHVRDGLTLIQGEVGQQVDVISATHRGVARDHVFDAGGTRYVFTCGSDFGVNPSWLAMADSIASLDGDIDIDGVPTDAVDLADDDLERVEVTEDGVALAFGTEWVVELETSGMTARLPPEHGETASLTRLLTASLPGGSACALYRYHERSMPLDELASWLGSLGEVSDVPDRIEWVELPAGDAVRLSETTVEGIFSVMYLVDGHDARYQLWCGSEAPVDDLWRTVADTLELPVDGSDVEVPPDEPDGGASWDQVGPFESVVSVSETEVMRASCERALWIEHADGTFEELMECVLIDDPVDPPDLQGAVPAETVLLEGGACEWVSDFWTAYDGSEVWASSWWVLVEPDGRVIATAEYAPELLECEDG